MIQYSGIPAFAYSPTFWTWSVRSLPPRGDTTSATSSALPVLIAAGRPAENLAGFRRSHAQALDALRVAELAIRPAGTVTTYDEAEIAALCTVDPERGRAFITAELGTLLDDDEATRRTRETLAAFYTANSNYRATATRLGVHHNTVRYRLQQAERALGRPLHERRLTIELALHLAGVIGPAGSPAHRPGKTESQ